MKNSLYICGFKIIVNKKMEGKTEFILCAAIKRLSPRECLKIYWNNDIYDIEIGYRHADILHRFKGEVSNNPYDQGFYTSKGRFVSREEAAQIAFEAGQISEQKTWLFSEDLY